MPTTAGSKLNSRRMPESLDVSCSMIIGRTSMTGSFSTMKRRMLMFVWQMSSSLQAFWSKSSIVRSMSPLVM